jgi:hypothetical protein
MKAELKEKSAPKENEERSLSKCPAKLAEMISLVNRVPFDLPMLDGMEVYRKYFQKYFYSAELGANSNESTFLIVFRKTLEECLTNLPDDFREYLEQKDSHLPFPYHDTKPDELILLRNKFSEYMSVYTLQKDLRSFVDYFAFRRKNHGDNFDIDRLTSELPRPLAKFITEETKDGTRVKVTPWGLSEALDGIIGERLRYCEICKNIFWAQRKESETCLPACANKLRVQRHREKLRQ